jgi:hypothetical protein
MKSSDQLLKLIWNDLQLEVWQYKPLEQILDFLNSDKPREQLFMCITGAHGTGKTSLMTWAILASLLILTSANKQFKGSLYSGKFDQLKTTLLREAMVWARNSNFNDYFDLHAHKLGIKNSPCAIDAKSWSLTDIQKSAGQHAETSLIFIDEATAVPRELIDKLNGSTTDKRVLWLMTCNPDKNHGFIYDLYEYNPFPWVTYRVAHSDLTFMRNHEFEERTLSVYGEDSDIYRVQVKGEFPKYSSSAFIDRAFLDTARLRVPMMVDGACYKMAVDVAGGMAADDSCIVVRKGGEIVHVWIEKVLLDELKMQIYKVAEKFRLNTFAIDEVGIGMGLSQTLRGHFPTLVAVNGASNASNKVRFYNRRAELYSELRDWVMLYGAIPKDALFNRLVEEMAGLEHEFRGTQLKICSKKEMKKSPDFADALAYTFAVPDIHQESFSYNNVGITMNERNRRGNYSY